MKIQQTTPGDYPGLAALINSIYPESSTTAAEIAEDDKRRDPRFKFQRWVAIEEGQVVGAGNYSQSIWFCHPQKFRVWIGVAPGRQGGGIGAQIYEAILQGLLPFDPIALRAMITDDRPQSIRFLEKRGFREVIRDVRSELDVQTFDPARFTGLEDRSRAEGIEIKTLPELANDSGRDQKLYDLDWELSLSVPGDLAAGIGRRGLEKYVGYAISGPDAIPECFFIAARGEEFIGLSHALSLERGVSLYQGLTGVRPAYRRMGIGIAMKVRGILYARATGHTLIRAENDVRNTPMLAMNQRLGFKRTEDLITFEKTIRDG